VSITSLLRRRPVQLLLVAGLAVAAAGLALFQPWKLVVDETVNEAAPPGLETPVAAPASASGPSRTPEATRSAAPVLLASGDFVSHEHRTTGAVRVLGLPDGRRVLRIENLDTSNGPDLKVWITDAPVRAGRDGWSVFDDGRYVNLGRLKGNRGSQNYELPASVDLRRLSSLSIWCDRFNVSFGAVQLRLA
jgi:hypothetical protein